MLRDSITAAGTPGSFSGLSYAQCEHMVVGRRRPMTEAILSTATEFATGPGLPALAPRLPAFTPALRSALEPIYERMRRVVPAVEWAVHAPYVAAIQEWKLRRNAVVLAHNYQTPEIFHGIADITGDSLALAQQGAKTDADVIVLCGVHFMAETAKILSPEKTVLIPDLEAGCSLAESITGADVRLLKERYPGVPVVTYVNTSAEVKAESDICCTSANAVQVVEWAAREWGVDRVILIPDEYLARNVAAQTTVGKIGRASCRGSAE